MKKQSRYLYMDILNILAIIGVVAMHCNGIVHTFSTARCWKTSLVVDVIFYFAVPVFIMLSGANLMDYRKKYDTKAFFRKRVSRVLIPTIVWITIVAIWKMFIIKTIDIGSINIVEFLNMVFNNKIEFTYYYLFVILGIYLTLPLLSQLTDNKYRKTLWYVVLTFFIFNALIPNLLLLFGIKWNKDFTILIGGYLIYVILGYLLSTQDIPKKYRYILYGLAILGMLYRYVTTYIYSYDANTIIKTTWGYMQFHAIIQACAVFLFIKNLNLKKLETNKKITSYIAKISSCSFGVYLIHLIVKYYEVELLSINVRSWQWRTIGVITTYLISLLIVLIIKKIPVLKRIVG